LHLRLRSAIQDRFLQDSLNSLYSMAKQRTTRSRTIASGRLRIGDEWNAIEIIASTQTHPLKAICELAENALDAGAAEVVIVRRRTHGALFLEVIDDGQGVARDADGLPDFARIATHVCDSMKRHLAERDRRGIHGEFGIGLLSFWSLGETLRMVAAGADGNLYEMQLDRGNRTYTVRPVRGQLSAGGTRVIVGPLLPATRNIVTGEKLQRYLSEELRDRIRNSRASVRIFDHLSHKQLLVEPREFSGERLPVAARWATPFGEVLAELYYRPDGDGADAGVAVCKDGTRVLRDITELEQFQHSPWTDGLLVGVLDFGSFALAPGTRSGIVPDERLMAFAAAVQEIESGVLGEIAQRDAAESDRASRDILRQVQRAFVSALRDLPSNEYLFFDIPESRPALGKAPEGAGDSESVAAGARLPERGAEPSGAGVAGDDGQILLPLEVGALTAVRIRPRNPRREPGKDCRLTATAMDANGIVIEQGIEFGWHVVDGGGVLHGVEGPACCVTSPQPGQVVVEVRATQAGASATDQVTVKFLESGGASADDSAKGLPAYRLEAEHGHSRRSRYDVVKNEIVINSGHRDFLASKASVAKHRRYIGKLYAKEVVLINFPHESPAEVLERLVEITLRTEDVL
jgi:hypothetical protein